MVGILIMILAPSIYLKENENNIDEYMVIIKSCLGQSHLVLENYFIIWENQSIFVLWTSSKL